MSEDLNYPIGDANRLNERFKFMTELSDKEARMERRLDEIMLAFIEVMDSFDRFIEYTKGSDDAIDNSEQGWCETILSIQRQLEKALQNAGVQSIQCAGMRVEPGKHQVVGVDNVEGVSEDTIVKELFRGYTRDERVIRKPQVIVASGKAAEESKS